MNAPLSPRAKHPLLAAYRTDALRRAMPTDADGLPARTLLALRHREVRAPFDVPDVDTPEDLDAMTP